MTAILSVEQFRVCEGSSQVCEADLIRRAGAAVVRELVRHFSRQPVVILCGPGNNGRDGAVVAKFLRSTGWQVRVLEFSRRGGVAGGVGSETLDGFSISEKIVVDAIFGIGLSRPVVGDILRVIEWVNASDKCVVSIDIPSGINSDTGEVMGIAIKSDLTVTFSCLKFGHVISPGRYYSGRICVKDIGLEIFGPHAFRNSPSLWRELIPIPDYKSHKYNRGYAVVCSVGMRSVGAVKLATLGALRIGAGAVAVACEDSEIALYAGSLTAVMYKTYEEAFCDSRVTALLIGSGGDVLDQYLKEKVLAVLNLDKKCVLDAGAISVFQDDVDVLLSHISGRSVVMTPHEGEFKRIFPGLSGSVVERAKSAAEMSGAIVVLKGHDTVIAAPDARVVVNNNAPSSLATVGSGDVLAGIITGLISTGMPEFFAACCGVWIHGECGKRHAFGLIADDIIQRIPKELGILLI
ncbi:MAG: NAD(P)H-hydrate dehydratase [Anaplasma sp.]